VPAYRAQLDKVLAGSFKSTEGDVQTLVNTLLIEPLAAIDNGAHLKA
jgi:hypothetical protein